MIPLLSLRAENLNPKPINEVINVLESGGLIIYPTDTVYAMGCLANKSAAVARLAQLKGLKIEKAQFSFLFSSLSALSAYVKPFDTPTFKILNRCLPGPFTFILAAVKKLPKPFDKRKQIGIRIVDSPFVNTVLEKLSAPLITTSIHHEDTLVDYETDPNAIYEMWCDHIDLMVETGYGGNQPSTVVDLTGAAPEILRHGKGDVGLI